MSQVHPGLLELLVHSWRNTGSCAASGLSVLHHQVILLEQRSVDGNSQRVCRAKWGWLESNYYVSTLPKSNAACPSPPSYLNPFNLIMASSLNTRKLTNLEVSIHKLISACSDQVCLRSDYHEQLFIMIVLLLTRSLWYWPWPWSCLRFHFEFRLLHKMI
jgi:hypothetical protein